MKEHKHKSIIKETCGHCGKELTGHCEVIFNAWLHYPDCYNAAKKQLKERGILR